MAPDSRGRDRWSWTNGREIRESSSITTLLLVRYLPRPYAWWLSNVADRWEALEISASEFRRTWRQQRGADDA